MEEWKPIERLDGKFYISSEGRVKNNKSGKVLKHRVNTNGYCQVALKPNGRAGGDLCLRIHREVALAFIPNPDNKATVNHIDGNKENNAVSNLEWATMSENMTHAYDTGLKSAISGEASRLSKLSKEQVNYIRSNPNISNVEFGRMYGVHRSAISKIRRGVHWKNELNASVV